MRYFLLMSCAVIMSCNTESTAPASADSTTTTATSATVPADTAAAIVTPSCYAHQTSNNIVWLKLNAVRPAASGELTYDFMGKDKNEGTFSGTMRGDTLYADYTFMSGGKQSARRVVFLRRGDAFIEGSGKSRDSLAFNGVILKEVPCTPQ